MPRLATLSKLLALMALVSPLASAGVIEVEPGVDPSTALSTAVLAAADGDTLILLPGAWSFPSETRDPVNLGVVGKGLTIIAAAGTRPSLSSAVIKDLPAGHQLVLRGIDFEMNSIGWMDNGGGAILIENCAGDVWIEDALTVAGDQAASGTIFPSNVGWAGVSVMTSTAVSLVRCTLTGGKGANDFPGGAHPDVATMGGAGLQTFASNVTVHDCVMQGGPGGLGGSLSLGAKSGAGVYAHTSSVLLAGGSATGGDSTGLAPGDGLWVLGTSSLMTRDVLLAAGTGAGSAVDVNAPPGTVTSFPAPARSLELPMWMHEQSTGTMVIDGVQGDLVALFASPKGAVQFFPGKQGAFLLGAPLSASFILGANPMPSGHWSINFGTPALPASVDAVTVLLQLVVHDGTQVLFEGGSATVLLDSTLP
jgi:hypothetical protein